MFSQRLQTDQRRTSSVCHATDTHQFRPSERVVRFLLRHCSVRNQPHIISNTFLLLLRRRHLQDLSQENLITCFSTSPSLTCLQLVLSLSTIKMSHISHVSPMQLDLSLQLALPTTLLPKSCQHRKQSRPLQLKKRTSTLSICVRFTARGLSHTRRARLLGRPCQSIWAMYVGITIPPWKQAKNNAQHCFGEHVCWRDSIEFTYQNGSFCLRQIRLFSTCLEDSILTNEPLSNHEEYRQGSHKRVA